MSQPEQSTRLATLELSVLLTVLYSDLFDFPLTPDEVHRVLVEPCDDGARLETAIDALEARSYLVRRRGFVCLTDRESLVALRESRQERAADRWPRAARFARWLTYVPFVRMVAVSGSQAVENPRLDSDVDFFCITAPQRLWIAQSCTMVLRRVARLAGLEACPNYFLSTDALEVSPRNLYTAREIAQAQPLWGLETHRAFLQANRWIEAFLPNARPRPRSPHAIEAERPLLRGWAESLLAGRLGDFLDRAIRRVLLVYYRLRRRAEGWRREEFERAYERRRQVVIANGYLQAVARRFRQRAHQLTDQQDTSDAVDRLFPEPARRDSEDSLYENLFDQHYGSGHV